MLEKGQDILDESYSDDESVGAKKSNNSPALPAADDDSADADDIRRLKIRKEELERRRKLEEESRKVRNDLLSEHVSVMLEVCPKTLVPDTNCFVDHLSELVRLSAAGTYQLRVPVVVINELDGLAKGTKNQLYQVRFVDLVVWNFYLRFTFLGTNCVFLENQCHDTFTA
jgi:protein SMG6